LDGVAGARVPTTVCGVDITAVELRRVAMPLVVPFRTSFGTQHARDVLLVRVLTPDAEGWGECVALTEPVYSCEYVEGAQHVLRTHLVPRLLAGGVIGGAAGVAGALAAVQGHRMAKGALEMAVLDAELRATGESLAARLGAVRDRVPCGVSVGIADSVEQLCAWVDGYVEEGYLRVKLKIAPGWDLEPVRAVRERHADLALQVDGNGAYSLDDADTLAALDAFDLLMVEQPFGDDALRDHAALAERLATPLCLDESITSVNTAVAAIELGACRIVNIKAGRVGGYLEARRIAEACARRDVPVWCGGMVETGLGRAANVALAATPGFTLPGDTSASARFYAQDLTEPFVLSDGRLEVPTGPGLGVSPLPAVLAEVTTAVELVRA
jgi:o-succinylbenzoate synthase